MTHGPTLRVVCASGGNAGLAAACAAQVLGVPCTIYLPNGVDARTHAFLHNVGAEVVAVGRFYVEALRAAEAAVRTQPNAYVAGSWRLFQYHCSSVPDLFSGSVLVPAYDHPTLWEGHASMIAEIRTQLPHGVKPAAVFCSVGGGGLLGGVIEGCRNVGWDDGAPSFINVMEGGLDSRRSPRSRARDARLRVLLLFSRCKPRTHRTPRRGHSADGLHARRARRAYSRAQIKGDVPWGVRTVCGRSARRTRPRWWREVRDSAR